jgi:hypothetical protein
MPRTDARTPASRSGLRRARSPGCAACRHPIDTEHLTAQWHRLRVRRKLLRPSWTDVGDRRDGAAAGACASPGVVLVQLGFGRFTAEFLDETLVQLHVPPDHRHHAVATREAVQGLVGDVDGEAPRTEAKRSRPQREWLRCAAECPPVHRTGYAQRAGRHSWRYWQESRSAAAAEGMTPQRTAPSRRLRRPQRR